MNFDLNPILPVGVIASGALALTVALIYGSVVLLRKNIPRKWVLILGIFRLLAIIIFTLCLLRPAISRVRSILQNPDLLVMVDTSQSMALSDPPEQISRFDKVLGVLQKSPLASEYLSRFKVYWFAFDENARPIKNHELQALTPVGQTTSYGKSLKTAWSFYRQMKARESGGGAQSGRILIVSDGHDREGGEGIEVARRLGPAIDTLAPSAAAGGKEAPQLEIANVQSPGRALSGSESKLLVTVRQSGAEKVPLVMTLAEDGKTIRNYEFAFTPNERERRINLSCQPGLPGIRQYSLRVAPRDSSAKIRASAPYTLSLKVESGKNEVLFLEDAWRWEFKFLRRVFENDPNFSFTGFMARAPGIFMQFGEPDRQVALAGFPQTRPELAAFDIFVLGDVNPSHWPQGFAAALYDLVVEEGKSLMVIAGPNIARIASVPELNALLPVEVSAQTAQPIAGPVAEQISAEGSTAAFFSGPNGKASAACWSKLPPLDQIYAPLRKRPAATILLEAADRANDYGNLIIAAEHTVGRGRVLFIGTDTLWKWQMISPRDADGNTPYSFFWQQALRAMRPRRLTAGGANLWIQTDRSRYTSPATVSLTVEVEFPKSLGQPAVEGQVTLPDNRNFPLVFTPHPAKAGVFESEFGVSGPGQYRISASLNANGKAVADTVTAIEAHEPAPETDWIVINEANLAQIAAVSGGKKIDADDPASWPEFSPTGKIPVQQTRTFKFWQEFWLLIILTAVLGLDWFIRLMRGYV